MLTEAYRNHSSHRVRERAQALLLSGRGYPVVRLSEIFRSGKEPPPTESGSSYHHGKNRQGVQPGQPAVFAAGIGFCLETLPLCLPPSG